MAATPELSTDERERLAKGLRALLNIEAADAQGSDPDRALVHDPKYPGYLWRKVGDSVVYVPFNLARVSPRANILTEVIAIGEKVRVSNEGTVCISGSTTFLGSLQIITDLDYCEYYVDLFANIKERLTIVSSMAELPLILAKLANVEYRCTEDGKMSELATRFMDDPQRLKLDFMSCGQLGPMPTTNVILPNEDGGDGQSSQTFAYQEAVVGGAEPYRALVDPINFGRYLRFLQTEIHKYIDLSNENPIYAVKALKRVLSLLLASGYHDEVNQVVSQLNRPEIEGVVEQMRLEELIKMQNFLPNTTPSHFTDGIKSLSKKNGISNKRQTQEVLLAVRDLATSFLAQFENDCREYA